MKNSSFGFASSPSPAPGPSSRAAEWSLKSLLDFSPVSAAASIHLRKVYSCLLMLCAASAAGVYLHLCLNLGGILSMLGAIALIVGVAATRNQGTSPARLAMFAGFGLLEGMSLGPLIQGVLSMEDGASIAFT